MGRDERKDNKLWDKHTFMELLCSRYDWQSAKPAQFKGIDNFESAVKSVLLFVAGT